MVLRFVKGKKIWLKNFHCVCKFLTPEARKMQFTYLILFTRSLLHINIFSFIYYMDIQAHSFQFLINSFFFAFFKILYFRFQWTSENKCKAFHLKSIN